MLLCVDVATKFTPLKHEMQNLLSTYHNIIYVILITYFDDFGCLLMVSKNVFFQMLQLGFGVCDISHPYDPSELSHCRTHTYTL